MHANFASNDAEKGDAGLFGFFPSPRARFLATFTLLHFSADSVELWALVGCVRDPLKFTPLKDGYEPEAVGLNSCLCANVIDRNCVKNPDAGGESFSACKWINSRILGPFTTPSTPATPTTTLAPSSDDPEGRLRVAVDTKFFARGGMQSKKLPAFSAAFGINCTGSLTKLDEIYCKETFVSVVEPRSRSPQLALRRQFEANASKVGEIANETHRAFDPATVTRADVYELSIVFSKLST